jgi:acetyl esterase/lipase
MTARFEVAYDEVASLAPATNGERISYARESPHQFGVLRLPIGRGPHPVVALVHGGCWLADYDHAHVESAAEALRALGVAVWSIEYRRLGQDGGGWPGTFRDVALGLDHLRALAHRYALDLGRIVAVGHSAGGHLALWLAARPKLAPSSDLFVADPLAIAGVVSLAGIADLRAYTLGSGRCNASVVPLLGGAVAHVSARYAEASPVELAPLGVPLRIVHGARDAIVPVTQSEALAAAERAGGGDTVLNVLPRAGHFDLIAPFADAWRTVERRVLEFTGRRARIGPRM